MLCSFQLFVNGHIHNVVSTLINVVKLLDENNNVIPTLSNVHINFEIDNVDSTLLNVVNFNVEKHNVVSTLIWTLIDVATSCQPNKSSETMLFWVAGPKFFLRMSWVQSFFLVDVSWVQFFFLMGIWWANIFLGCS